MPKFSKPLHFPLSSIIDIMLYIVTSLPPRHPVASGSNCEIFYFPSVPTRLDLRTISAARPPATLAHKRREGSLAFGQNAFSVNKKLRGAGVYVSVGEV